MTQENLGKLQKVDLREVWNFEASDFTPWLANEDNIQFLGDTIAIDLELEAQEKNVGAFRADILCKDTDNGNWVLIENQLERTDHTHLGQLLTYAAGLQAVTVVWIASTFTEEHRATLDWLNEITDDSFRFFGLEIELWRIGDSPAAPKLNIVSKPNDWSRSVTQYAKRIREEALTELQKKQLRYWDALKAAIDNRESSISPQKPSPQHWANYGIGRTGFHIAATINSRESRLAVELSIQGIYAKPHYYLLYKERKEIEKSIGTRLEWMELPLKKTSRIVLFKSGCDPTDEDHWPSQHEWFIEAIEKFDNTFRSRVKALNASDWIVDDENNGLNRT